MKRKLLAAVLLLTLLLTGCGGKTMQADENTFLLRFRADVPGEVYAVTVDCIVAGEEVGSCTVINADESPLNPKEWLVREYVPGDFPENADLSTLELRFSLTDGSGEILTCSEPVRIPAEYGETYDVVIRPDAAELTEPLH